MRKAWVLILMIPAVLFAAVTAQAQTSQGILSQYVADLQKTPNDCALREKIIKHVLTMKSKPAIPEGSRRHYVMAKTLSDEAKKVEDFNDAIAEFRGALLVAPWWAEANRDFGLTLEAAQRYDEAIAYIKLYMAANPGSDRSRAAQDEIYKIEAKKKLAGKAAKESSPMVVSAPKQNTFEDLLRKIDGRRYTLTESHGATSVLDIRGRTIVRGTIENGRYLKWTGEVSRVEIRGRETTVSLYYRPFKINAVSMTFLISEDGYSITGRTRFSDGDSRDYIHLWQR